MRARFVSLAVLVVLALGALGAAPGVAAAGDRDTARDGDAPDLVGTWVGDYEFPSGTDAVIATTETLIIERQKGRLVWGHDQYEEDGETIEIPVRGTIGRDGQRFTLAEEHGFFMGEILGPKRVHVWFVRTDAQYTTFEAILRRQTD